MAGRNPSAARKAFLEPIQRALSCITPAQIVRTRAARPGDQEALTTSEDPLILRRRGTDAPRLGLSLAQRFVVAETDDPDRGPWKVSTRAYSYRIEDDASRELASWHWHPLGSSAFTAPHLHVGWTRLRDLHLPSERVSVEAVVRLLITELDVRPRRDDWSDVLDRAEQAFREWRTWPGQRSTG